MNTTKRDRITRNLNYWLCEPPERLEDIGREKVLEQIAINSEATVREVWQVYTEMLGKALGNDANTRTV